MLQRKQIMAAIVGLTSLGISAIASAALPGFYVGGQAGYGNTHYTGSGVSTTGLAGRASVGYQFDQNFAVETGYTQFSNATGPSGFKVRERAVDLVAKGILPLANCFSAYGKLGVAYVTANPNHGYSSKSKLYPAAGVGVSYDVTPNVPISLGWDRIQRIGSANSVRSTDFISLGVAYNFG